MIKPKRFTPHYLSELMQTPTKFPNLFTRIDKNIREKKPTILIIDGKTQTGKSVLARYICDHYDEKWLLFFTIEDVLNHILEIKNNLGDLSLGFNAISKEYYNRWQFLDEPQLEAPSETHWSPRNQILQAYSSAFGFIKNGLVLALCDIQGISRKLYKNITLRITMVSYESSNGELVRKAYVKLPIWNDIKMRYYWITVQEFRVPFIEDNINYEGKKVNNFFNIQLEKWQNKLKIGEKPDYLTPDFYREREHIITI